MLIKTDCGHDFTKPDTWPDDPSGATTDCPECNGLLMLVKAEDGSAIGRNFHEYMHEQDPRWPKDGANTGYVSF